MDSFSQGLENTLWLLLYLVGVSDTGLLEVGNLLHRVDIHGQKGEELGYRLLINTHSTQSIGLRSSFRSFFLLWPDGTENISILLWYVNSLSTLRLLPLYPSNVQA